MQPGDLKAFVPFADLSSAALAAAAAASRRLRLPARRWLVRPGRVLTDHLFLLEGRVLLLAGGSTSVVGAGSARARRAVYPGAAGVETLTDAVFISVAAAVMEGPAALTLRPSEAAATNDMDHSPALACPSVSAADDCWQRRFLMSPLMQRLPPVMWQRVLRAMTRHTFAAGERLIEAGASGDCCYVLTSGQALILRPDGAPFARVKPGQLFGEDALVTGAARNASVVMSTPGAAVSLPAPVFQRWLLDTVVQPLSHRDGRCPLRLGDSPEDVAGERSLAPGKVRGAAARLSGGRRYAILGGHYHERVLAAFLLAEQGIDALPLEPDEAG